MQQLLTDNFLGVTTMGSAGVKSFNNSRQIPFPHEIYKLWGEHKENHNYHMTRAGIWDGLGVCWPGP